ncbi:hypothetical protein CNYM01_05274 [Colletotrichum nymphaeae SA-01]|uniref:Uncharacterized protein n=1 Tax=Colletotrichum nymphaeae SA-01 TaxID=1460502 RepID=A0A135RRQ6_9PEZI|nr:hypothetical protein CNYM01_05274 [Colletotrichum nymphaeae SA-01]
MKFRGGDRGMVPWSSIISLPSCFLFPPLTSILNKLHDSPKDTTWGGIADPSCTKICTDTDLEDGQTSAQCPYGSRRSKKGLASCNHNYYHLQHIFSLSHARLEQFRNTLSWSTDGIRTSFPVLARCSWAIITTCHFRHRGHHHLHHSDHVHDLDLDHFGKVAQPTEAVPTVWSLSAPAPAPALAPAAPNMLIDIIEMPSTGVRMGNPPFGQAPGPHGLSLRFHQTTSGTSTKA